MRIFLSLLTLTLVISTLQFDVKIVSSPDRAPHPAPCTLICSGEDSALDWTDSRWLSGKVHKYIDMSDCGFVSPPVVTVSSRGSYGVCPSLFMEMSTLSSDDFVVFSVEDSHARDAIRNQCFVHWIATGYNC